MNEFDLLTDTEMDQTWELALYHAEWCALQRREREEKRQEMRTFLHWLCGLKR